MCHVAGTTRFLDEAGQLIGEMTAEAGSLVIYNRLELDSISDLAAAGEDPCSFTRQIRIVRCPRYRQAQAAACDQLTQTLNTWQQKKGQP